MAFGTLEAQVAADNPVQVVDAFVDKLALQNLGLPHFVHKTAGRGCASAKLAANN
jgi:hypothetical protein